MHIMVSNDHHCGGAGEFFLEFMRYKFNGAHNMPFWRRPIEMVNEIARVINDIYFLAQPNKSKTKSIEQNMTL